MKQLVLKSEHCVFIVHTSFSIYAWLNMCISHKYSTISFIFYIYMIYIYERHSLCARDAKARAFCMWLCADISWQYPRLLHWPHNLRTESHFCFVYFFIRFCYCFIIFIGVVIVPWFGIMSITKFLIFIFNIVQ